MDLETSGTFTGEQRGTWSERSSGTYTFFLEPTEEPRFQYLYIDNRYVKVGMQYILPRLPVKRNYSHMAWEYTVSCTSVRILAERQCRGFLGR